MMNSHTHTRNSLYDFVAGDLAAADRERVEIHLRACDKCRKELEDIRTICDLPVGRLRSPADLRSEQFWCKFSDEVARRIESQAHAKRRRFSEEFDALIAWLVVRQRSLLAASAVAVAAAIAVFVWKPILQTGNTKVTPRIEYVRNETTTATDSETVREANRRVGDYFRKSRTLLIGLTNMKLDDGQPVDLATEQTVSRELVHEARYLKRQPIDVRSSQLIGDLERILIELANLKEEHDVPDVEIIRAGIHQENLLFKIRMAETSIDRSHIRQSTNNH